MEAGIRAKARHTAAEHAPRARLAFVGNGSANGPRSGRDSVYPGLTVGAVSPEDPRGHPQEWVAFFSKCMTALAFMLITESGCIKRVSG